MGKKKRTQKQRKEKKIKKAKVQQDRWADRVYELVIPAYIEESSLETLVQIVEEELQEGGEVYGYGEHYDSRGFFKHCYLEFYARDTNKVIDRIISTLSDHGLPLGSGLWQNDKVIKRIGRLHVIKVGFSPGVDQNPMVTHIFAKRFHEKTLALLSSVQVFSAFVTDIDTHKVALYYYVIDKELAMEAIDACIEIFRLVLQANVQIIDSKMTVQEYYMNQMTRPYRHFIQPIWRKMQKEWKGVKESSQQELQKVFPKTPQGVLDMLSVVDGTWNKRFSSPQLKVPLFMVEEQTLYLLSAEEMMTHSSEGLNILKPALEASVRPKGVRARLSQWNACLIAKSEEGESRLYIDYHPTKEGIEGQVLFYDGHSERMQVVAASFAKFLATMIGNNWHTYSLSIIQTLTELVQTCESQEVPLKHDTIGLIQKGLAMMEADAERKLKRVKGERGMLGIVPFAGHSFNFSELVTRLRSDWNVKVDVVQQNNGEGYITWPGEEEKEQTAYELCIEGVEVILTFMLDTMPEHILKEIAAENISKEVRKAISEHQTYVMVIAVENGRTDLEKDCLTVKILDSLSRQAGALCVCANRGAYDKVGYQQRAQLLHSGELPTENLVWFTIEEEGDGTTSLVTSGLEMYDLLELELKGFPYDVEQMKNYALTMVGHLIRDNIQLSEGDTFQDQEGYPHEVSIVTRKDSNQQMLRVEYYQI